MEEKSTTTVKTEQESDNSAQVNEAIDKLKVLLDHVQAMEDQQNQLMSHYCQEINSVKQEINLLEAKLSELLSNAPAENSQEEEISFACDDPVSTHPIIEFEELVDFEIEATEEQEIKDYEECKPTFQADQFEDDDDEFFEAISALQNWAPEDPLIGQILFDRYVILKSISESNISKVYLANDMEEDRMVALKVINNSDEELEEAFEEEVKLVAMRCHKNIVQYIDFQKHEQQGFYIMEYLEAPNLNELLETIDHFETEGQIASVAIQLADAISYLHRMDSGHGNLYDSNIMFPEADGEVLVKLCGFGTTRVKEILKERDILPQSSIDSNVDRKLLQKFDCHRFGDTLYRAITGRKVLKENADDIALSIVLTRPELFGIKVLSETLRSCWQNDESNTNIFQLKEDFEKWLESARMEIVGSLPAEQRQEALGITNKWLRSYEGKSVREVQEAVNKAMELKNKQEKFEDSITEQFTKVLSVDGHRRSPKMTLALTTVSISLTTLIVFILASAAMSNLDQLQTAFVQASHSLSSKVWRSKNSTDFVAEEIPFNYSEDSYYRVWTRNKVVSPPSRIDVDGKLKPQ